MFALKLTCSIVPLLMFAIPDIVGIPELDSDIIVPLSTCVFLMRPLLIPTTPAKAVPVLPLIIELARLATRKFRIVPLFWLNGLRTSFVPPAPVGA